MYLGFASTKCLPDGSSLKVLHPLLNIASEVQNPAFLKCCTQIVPSMISAKSICVGLVAKYKSSAEWPID